MHALVIAAALLAGAPSEREARLVGLAKVWAYVKYVHPAMATSGVDWDAALVRALPAAGSAASDEAYRASIASLLAELQDPATRLLPRETPPVPAATASEARLRLESVDARTAVVVVPSGPDLESTPDLQAEICARFTEAAGFERAVVDLRSPSGRRPGWVLASAIVKCAGRLLGQDVTLPPARYLTHGFYMMQSVTGGAGGGQGPWESGLSVVGAGSVRSEGGRTPRLVFLVNAGSADVYPLLMALQGEGLAEVVQEGEVPGAGLLVTTFDASDDLRVEVRHGERLRRDGGAGFVADVVVPAGATGAARDRALALLDGPTRAATAAPTLVPYVPGAFVERDHSETPYPDREHRLLALFRLYGAIEYFFAYKDLMDRPWAETLAEMIPRFTAAKDANDYALAVSEAAVRIQDSHVTLASPVLDAYFGTHRPAVRVDLVEGQTVITEVAPELAPAGLTVGDVVVSVDGEPADLRRERLARYLPASTPARLANKIDIQFLLGPRAKPAVIEARGAEGPPRRVTVARTLEGLAPRSRTRGAPVYGLHAPGFGYVDLNRLEGKDVADAFETVRKAPGLILDMRGYPVGGAFPLVGRLARPQSPPAFLGGSIRYEGSEGTFSLVESLFTQEVPGPGYSGPVVILADGSTQSAAEHVCALLKSTLDATVVGSQTSGANGGVTRTILPGGIVVNFTAQSMRLKDGTRVQRVGIVPDVEVRPTLAGVRAGRDELLERAVEVLKRATAGG